MQFLEEMLHWSAGLAQDSKTILVGDLNVAPLPEDVWSHKQLRKVITHTPVETDKLDEILQAHDWVDVMRHFVPATEPLFSWWSYRARDWQAANRGRRLDHVWVSPSLKSSLVDMDVFLPARSWEKPSDHAPVVTTLEL